MSLKKHHFLWKDIRHEKGLDHIRSLTNAQVYLIDDDLEGMWKEFQQNYKIIEASGGIVKNDDGQVLFIFRNGIWDLPKGKIEFGESREEAGMREVEEECGITGLILQRLLMSTYHIYKLNNDLMLKKTDWFEMKYKGDSAPIPLAKEDISQVRWIKRVRLKEVYDNTFTSIIDVIKMILPTG